MRACLSDPVAAHDKLKRMDAKTHSALELGWRLVIATLERLSALAGRNWLTGPIWARAFAELRRAEGAARRMLVVLAAGVTVEAVRPCRKKRRRITKTAPNAPKRLGFALFDPLPELSFGARHEAPHPCAAWRFGWRVQAKGELHRCALARRQAWASSAGSAGKGT
ncbi:MAG: hypothetical protein MRY64_09810 [Hyphomonadaceae bacterium]|nr:hypothetical protein [Hyphomonadaceae bacterium]